MSLVPHLCGMGRIASDGVSFSGYRLNVGTTYGASYQVTEFQLYDSVGGSNILTGGTATSSSGTAANAFDGDSGTKCVWAGLPGWVQMRKGSIMLPRYLQAVYPSSSANAIEFNIQGTDNGTDFVTLYSSTEGQFLPFDVNGAYTGIYPMTGEAWMLSIHAVRGGGTVARIGEWALRDGGGSNVLSGGLPFASSAANHTVNAPAVMFDGDPSTYWTSASLYSSVGTTDVYVAYMQPDAADTHPVTLYLAASPVAADTPSSFTLRKMAKGASAWTTIGTYSWPSGASTSITI